MKSYISIIIVHYSKVDDFGEARNRLGKIRFGINNNATRSEMMKASLTSLFENTDYPVEVIVVDNGGSPDDSNWLLDMVREGKINTYIRNKDNMHFGWARNQGINLATSDYICICDNDLLYKLKWLSTTIKPLFEYPDRKLIATPFITPDKMKGKNPRGTLDGYRLNSMAGSNCMIMSKEDYFFIGPFTTHHITGSHWHRRMNQMGYLTIAPPVDYVEHMGFRIGYNYDHKIKVQKHLIGGDMVDYTFEYTK